MYQNINIILQLFTAQRQKHTTLGRPLMLPDETNFVCFVSFLSSLQPSLFQELHPDKISVPGQEHKRHLQVCHHSHGHRSSKECIHYCQDYYYWHQPQGLGTEIIICITINKTSLFDRFATPSQNHFLLTHSLIHLLSH